MDQKNCARCRKWPEDLLILVCNHNLCLTCSLSLLHEPPLSTEYKIVCGTCSIPTYITDETAEVLLDMRVSSSPVKPVVEKYTKICESHPDEEVTYFCLDCESHCICSECVIHGTHKGHEVSRIKQVYPLVKNKAEDLVDKMLKREELLDLHRKSLEISRKKLVENSIHIKQNISDVLQSLRDAIDIKEKELHQQVDSLLDGSVRKVDDRIQFNRQKIGLIRETNNRMGHAIDSLTNSDLINYYVDHKDELRADDRPASPIEDYPSALFNENYAIDCLERIKSFKISLKNK